VLWQSLVERAKGRADLLKDAAVKEQQIIDLERELKDVREAAAVDKKKLKEELIEEKRKAVEATAQFNTMATVLTEDYRIKVHMDLQADKSPVVVKRPFFPRVVNPRHRICGTMCNARIQYSKAR
jgi:hypothetical protein